jgi:threonine dehydrogenase-like Zn-dependent dehydrogenase
MYMSMARDIRRHSRVSYPQPVQVGWSDAEGRPRMSRGKCVDISDIGLSVEVSDRVPVGSYVTVRLQGVGPVGSASVRHLGRRGVKYVIGLEFTQGLRELTQALQGATSGS